MYNIILDFIYSDEEMALNNVYASIAYQAKERKSVVRGKTVISEVTLGICNCGRSSNAAKGVACIKEKHYMATRLYCNNCGRNYYPEEFHNRKNEKI